MLGGICEHLQAHTPHDDSIA